jgi:hypothetical protein
VRVGAELLSAPRIFINVGGRAIVPDLPGLNEISYYLTNSSILELERVPEHLVAIGGSYIGLEFAQMHRRFRGRWTTGFPAREHTRCAAPHRRQPAGACLPHRAAL